ncbi:MAG: hypothetical protein NT137_00195 [Methanomassiliicoccales archaeon]|nr:hypothetical protein [Methanomassiliicoccales archaeon]
MKRLIIELEDEDYAVIEKTCKEGNMSMDHYVGVLMRFVVAFLGGRAPELPEICIAPDSERREGT